ncbi:hypothetical protein [Cupriavidus basilensis]|jgi:hypothetical protein|uniref:hypothetical protein n=1 Tax=Cupriavidus basilensis TaxID=68895 RepID=UPI0023E80F00|nr:hypothetical protein [Cupriavidus basilensis]MDF3884774.1 hypothetical protein [Cupriavidus basilensis]
MIHGINDDITTRYECAAEILNTMIAINTSELAKEEAKARPNKVRFSKLMTEGERLALERRKLDPEDRATIEHILKDYAAVVKEKLELAPSLATVK